MRRADRQSIGGLASEGVAYAPPRSVAPHQASRGGLSRAIFPPPPNARYAPNGHAELGSLFREIRRVLGLSLPDVARMLDCRLEIITALEMGNVQALPAWPDTVRIVTQYAVIARVDAAPVLSLIRRGLDQARGASAAVPRQKQQARPAQEARPAQNEPSERSAAFKAAFIQPFADAFSGLPRVVTLAKAAPVVDEDDEEPATPRFGWMRLDGRKSAGLVAALFIIVAYSAQGSSLQASLATLHPPLVKLMRGAQDYLLHRAAPMREGLRWIEVDDPRSRRADRLPSKR